MKKYNYHFSKTRKKSRLPFVFSLQLVAIAAFFSLVFIGCRKIASNESKLSEDFTTETAKEWYYEVFKKSDEFKKSTVKGKQLPDWGKGIYNRVGKFEIVEFPLNANKHSLRFYNSSNLTKQQITRLFTASQKRIVFIKSADNNNIVVREVDYLPDWGYLEKKNFDISNINYSGEKNDFNGTLSVKKWGGSLIDIHRVKNGKSYIIKAFKSSSNEVSKKEGINSLSREITNNVPCPPVEVCLFEQECDFELQGDVWVNVGNCSELVNTGECQTFPGDCPPDDAESEDPCTKYGLDCPPGNGDPTPPEDCQNNEEAARQQLEKRFDDYVEDEISSAGFSLNGNFTTPDFTDIKTWEVVKGAYNDWRILAVTKATLTKDNPGVNANKTLTIEYLDSRYDGSNDIIITTWENPMHYETYNHNHTPTPVGKQKITGTLRHKMKANVKVKYKQCEFDFSLGKELVKFVQNELWVW